MLNDEPQEIIFGDALDDLLSEEQVPLSLLYRLSDMTDDEKVEFERQWSSATDDRRQEIIRHLVDISEENFTVDFQPVFSFCLSDPDALVRRASLDGLWDTTDLKLINPIIERLTHDTNPEVQAAAAGALAHFLLMSAWGELKGVPTEVIYEALMAAFRDPQSAPIVSRVALEAVGSVNSPEVSRAIEDSYESSDRLLQLSALFAMGNSADSRWLPILLDEMENPYEEMRQEAVRAAGNIGDSAAIPRLAELAYDDDEGVAQAAIEALGEIGGDQVQEILQAISEDSEMDGLSEVIELALENSSWNTLDLQYGLFVSDIIDEEE